MNDLLFPEKTHDVISGLCDVKFPDKLLQGELQLGDVPPLLFITAAINLKHLENKVKE